MMPRSTPVTIPSYLRGDADEGTLAGLVQSSRRLGRFWPLLAVAEPRPLPDPHPGFQVSSRSASLVQDLSEYGD